MKLLFVEDDQAIAMGLVYTLKKEGYEVVWCDRKHSALQQLDQQIFDLLLLDVGLPDGSGYDICTYAKSRQDVPVLFLTALDDEGNVVMGLDMGGDDYITKPFSVNELLARISAHLRREQRSHNKTKSKFSEELIIDYSDRSLYIKGNKIELSNKEFEIIQLLSSNAGQVFDREKIYECIWGIDGNGDSAVIKEHIRKIRLKFSEFTDKVYITTVWGVGYKWEK